MPADVQPEMARLTQLADAMCRCGRDPACADAIEPEMTRWAEDVARRKHEPDQPLLDEDQVRETATRYAECMIVAKAPPPS